MKMECHFRGQPLWEETNAGTTTDFDGNYQIFAESGQTLVFSYVGYESQSVAVGTSSSIDVQLQPVVENSLF